MLRCEPELRGDEAWGRAIRRDYSLSVSGPLLGPGTCFVNGGTTDADVQEELAARWQSARADATERRISADAGSAGSGRTAWPLYSAERCLRSWRTRCANQRPFPTQQFTALRAQRCRSQSTIWSLSSAARASAVWRARSDAATAGARE